MGKPNSIFKKQYEDYLRQVETVDFSQCAAVLDINGDEERRTAEIPFFKTICRVSRLNLARRD